MELKINVSLHEILCFSVGKSKCFIRLHLGQALLLFSIGNLTVSIPSVNPPLLSICKGEGLTWALFQNITLIRYSKKGYSQDMGVA